MAKTDPLSRNTSDPVKFTPRIELDGPVASGDDRLRRIVLFFMLEFFLDRIELGVGLKYRDKLDPWRAKMAPPLTSMIRAD